MSHPQPNCVKQYVAHDIYHLFMCQTLIVNGKSARLSWHCQMPYWEDILYLPSFALMNLTFVSFTGTPEEITFQVDIFQRCAIWKRSKASLFFSLVMPARKVKVTMWPMGVLCNSIGLCHAILQCVWCKRKAVCGHSMRSICLEIYSSTGVNMNSEHRTTKINNNSWKSDE